MLLKNDLASRTALSDALIDYYKKYGNRHMRIFSETEDKEWDAFDLHFLLDRKHVIKYGICGNRHSYTGGVGLAIGPHYFAPSDFWSYENSQRFKMAATTDAVEHNLRLLDEFLGYPVPKPPLG